MKKDRIASHESVLWKKNSSELNIDFYKFTVQLKPGWKFSEGTRSDCSGGSFMSVSDFFDAEPIKTNEVEYR